METNAQILAVKAWCSVPPISLVRNMLNATPGPIIGVAQIVELKMFE